MNDTQSHLKLMLICAYMLHVWNKDLVGCCWIFVCLCFNRAFWIPGEIMGDFGKSLVWFGKGAFVLSDSKLKNCSVCRSMNTRNTLSVWTKTAWCIPPSLWLNHAPTPCGRSSVCVCTALSAAGPIHGSSGRSQTHTTHIISIHPSFLSPLHLAIPLSYI